jgi:hypothetical protein
VTKYRAVPVPEGYHDLRILTGGLEVYPRLLAEAPDVNTASGATAQRAHAALVESSAPDGEWRVIRSAVARGQLTGDQGFVERVHRLTGRRIEHRGRGRPPRRR